MHPFLVSLFTLIFTASAFFPILPQSMYYHTSSITPFKKPSLTPFPPGKAKIATANQNKNVQLHIPQNAVDHLPVLTSSPTPQQLSITPTPTKTTPSEPTPSAIPISQIPCHWNPRLQILGNHPPIVCPL